MNTQPTMQQCQGCPDESTRLVPQGGIHLDDCSECFRHCGCVRSTMGEPLNEVEW